MKDIISALRTEEARLEKQLGAIRATIAAYSAGPEVVAAAVGTARRKTQARIVRQRKKRVEITDQIRQFVVNLKSMPADKRPTIADIAEQLEISDTTVQRIWAEHQKEVHSPTIATG